MKACGSAQLAASRRRYASSVCSTPEVLVPRNTPIRPRPYFCAAASTASAKPSWVNASCSRRLLRQSNSRKSARIAVSSTPGTTPINVSRSTVSKSQCVKPPLAWRSACSVCARPRPMQLVLVKCERRSGFNSGMALTNRLSGRGNGRARDFNKLIRPDGCGRFYFGDQQDIRERRAVVHLPSGNTKSETGQYRLPFRQGPTIKTVDAVSAGEGHHMVDPDTESELPSPVGI